mgnify:CR=1 FL=1
MAKLRHILCVDDDPDIRFIIAQALEFSLAADVNAVDSAQGAFDYLDTLTEGALPDLVLLDVTMPGTDGYAACERLRADDRYQAIPILFLTALVRDADRQRARAVGANGFLAKPFDPVSIGDDIDRALKAAW